MTAARLPFSYHVMSKPVGPICNLDCKYCFYLEKEELFPRGEQFRMKPEVLRTYVRDYIQTQGGPEISFAWQGGEPTLLGVEFFEEVVRLQAEYSDGRPIHNAFQTNGILLDDAWGEFLKKNGFLVGLSIDGPAELHDIYRVDKGGKPTFERVMNGLAVLKRHGVEFNTLTVVNAKNSKHPLKVYRFLREIGSGFIQFIPLVERAADRKAQMLGLELAVPPDADSAETAPVTEWSVRPNVYGDFLTTIFDEWVRRDVGKVYVQIFDVALGNWAGMGGGLCVFSEKCGKAMAIEHDGTVYSCDHYVYPQYALGNIMNTSLGAMAASEKQTDFGESKSSSLPQFCRSCTYRFACHGECPKHRFIRTPDGEAGLNYLCAAYKKFFHHIDPAMQRMTLLLRNQRAPAEVMEWVKTSTPQVNRNANVARGAACPCGSGKKFKFCCGK